MNRTFLKKYGYSEMYYNKSRIRQMYYTYLHQTVFDKIVDVLVVFAVAATFFTVVLEMVFPISPLILAILHSFSVLILFIFGLELFRDYAHSETRKEFFKKYWLDFVLVGFLSFYFVTGTYFGLARFNVLAELKSYFSELKYLKVSWRFLKFEF